MNIRNFTISKTKFLLSVLASIVLFSYSFDLSAQKVNFLTSSLVPAARGYVKVKKDKNNNYRIQIQLFDLAEVKRLQTAKETYVIWMETEEGVVKNIGQLDSSTSFLSKKLKANFETVSSFKPRKIFITAENEAGIQYPDTQIVLTTNTF